MRTGGYISESTARAMHLATGGVSVFDRQGEKVGVLISAPPRARGNHAAYAIICLGGCLRMGEELHPVPWSRLRYDPLTQTYAIDMTGDQLRSAPIYTHDSNWLEQRWNSRLESFYSSTLKN